MSDDPINRILEIIAFLCMAIVIVCILGLIALSLPIDEGGEVSRLATAGIMRNADV